MYEHMRAMREDHDFSQSDVAKILHVHQTTYSEYERGAINIPVAHLKRLALLYGTSIDYLVDFTNDAQPHRRREE